MGFDMNGVFNVIAALFLGGAIVFAGHTWSQNSVGNGMDEAELEAFKANTIKEVKAQLAESGQCVSEDRLAAVKASCGGSVQLGALEQPYASGVAISGLNGDDLSAYNGQGGPSDGDDTSGKPVDKPDSNEFFTENTRMQKSATSAPVDKPDSNQFFTENKRLIDKPDSNQFFTENKRLIDKPDDGPFFTENQPMDPCLRPDGSVYTGPGTAQDPFAAEDPCLIRQAEDVPFGIIDGPAPVPYTDPCIRSDGTIYTGPGTVTDPNSAEDPCLTEQRFATQDITDPCLNPDGSVYTGPGTAQDPFASANPCLPADIYAETTPYGIQPGPEPERYADPCLEGSARTSGDLLGAGDPCVTETREPVTTPDIYVPPVQVAGDPQTPVIPPVTTPRPNTFVSPYQVVGPRPNIPGLGTFGPQPTIPDGGSDYTRPMMMTMNMYGD